LDQMVRDINDAGFPPPTYLASGNGGNLNNYLANAPFAWSAGAGYWTKPCQIGTGGGGSCFTTTDATPGDFDIIIETEPNPLDPSCTPGCSVQWIRYQLAGPNGTTLMRAMAPKAAGTDPDAAFTNQYAPAPFVENVVNNCASLLNQSPPPAVCQLTAANPAVANPVPIFQYTCDTPSAPQFPLPFCASPLAGPDNSPANIRDVIITLIVAAPLPDATSGQARLVQLSGRGRRINPNQ